MELNKELFKQASVSQLVNPVKEAVNHIAEIEKLFANPEATLRDFGEALKKFEIDTMTVINKLDYILAHHSHQIVENDGKRNLIST